MAMGPLPAVTLLRPIASRLGKWTVESPNNRIRSKSDPVLCLIASTLLLYV
ncbi:LysR family transcriptional regulator [Sesbania bispinosa]|nr:LysR family transcriptional regulator [Sesbania bispinosa]